MKSWAERYASISLMMAVEMMMYDLVPIPFSFFVTDNKVAACSHHLSCATSLERHVQRSSPTSKLLSTSPASRRRPSRWPKLP